MDTNYYYFPGSWVNDRTGFFTGSGMPMRFADLDGTLIDVYQATTQMTDESLQTYPLTVNTLLDEAIGAEGYYGAFTANMHTDRADSTAQMRSSPRRKRGASRWCPRGRCCGGWMVATVSSFGSIAWNGDTLSFTITAGQGANNLRAMLPTQTAGRRDHEHQLQWSADQLHHRSNQGRGVCHLPGGGRDLSGLHHAAASGYRSADGGDDQSC